MKHDSKGLVGYNCAKKSFVGSLVNIAAVASNGVVLQLKIRILKKGLF
jgi:hypothetical protein